jgi:hypothetical protein
VVKLFFMFSTRHLKLHIAKLLLAAMLLQAFLPAWASMRTAGQSNWIEICVSSGIKWVKLTEPGHAGSQSASDHCLYCAATGAAPEFDVSVYLLDTLRYSESAALPSCSVAMVFPGHSLQSRAPPSFS